MTLPTQQSLRDAAKGRCDMVNSAFISDAEWNTYLNECGSELYDIILESDETALVTTVSIPTVSSQTLYQLPQNFYKISAMYEQRTPTILLAMDRMSAHDLSLNDTWPYFHNPTNGFSRYRYYMENLSLEIRPIPTGNFTIVFKYIPQFQQFTDDLSILGWPTVNGWEEFVITGSCIKALLKEGSVNQAQGFMEERARLENRIRKMATGKDRFSPRQVRDAYGITSNFRRAYLPNR